MATHPFLAVLALVTLILVAALILWQVRSARREQTSRGERLGEHKIQPKNPATNLHGIPQDPLDMPIHATVAPTGTGDESTAAARKQDPAPTPMS